MARWIAITNIHEDFETGELVVNTDTAELIIPRKEGGCRIFWDDERSIDCKESWATVVGAKEGLN